MIVVVGSRETTSDMRREGKEKVKERTRESTYSVASTRFAERVVDE
jgi:hypothetical protein